MVRKIPPEELVRVTKLEAARHQLESAIRLWFYEDSPVSILALAFASHEVIHKLFRKRGLKDDLIFNASFIDESYRPQWNKDIKMAAGFFKHSNRSDDNEAIVFDTRLGVAFMVMSLKALHQMKEPATKLDHAFLAWLMFQFPSDEIAKKLEAQSIDIEQLPKRLPGTRREFLEFFLKNYKG